MSGTDSTFQAYNDRTTTFREAGLTEMHPRQRNVSLIEEKEKETL
jgi:hypothetical protein